MSFKAVLYIENQERTLINAELVYAQMADRNGRPTQLPMGAPLFLNFASTARDELFYDYMFSSARMCKGYIRFFKRDGMQKDFDIEFANAHIIGLKEHFSSTGKEPMSIALTVSYGISRVRGIIHEKKWNPSNPFVSNTATPIQRDTPKQLEPEIIKGWWSYDEEGEEEYIFNNDKQTKLKLGETMYFHIQTKDIVVGEEIEMQLMDYDYLWWMGEHIDEYNIDTSKFPNNTVWKNPVVRALNGQSIATVKLVLDESWEPVIADDHDDKGSLDQTIELYWRVRYANEDGTKIKKILPERKADYLRVGYSDRTLYFRPGFEGQNLPELRSADGSPLFILNIIKDQTISKAKGIIGKGAKALGNKIEQSIDNMVLAKLEKGSLAMSDGEVYTHPNAAIKSRDIYTNEGRKISAKMRYPKSFKKGDKLISGKAVSQRDFFAQDGTKIKVLGKLHSIASDFSLISNVYDVFSYAIDDKSPLDESLNLDFLVGLTANPLMLQFTIALKIAGVMIKPVKAEWDEALNMAIEAELEQRKLEGISGIVKFANDFKSKGYFTRRYPSDIIDKMLIGEFKSYDELDNSIRKSTSNKIITVLLKRIENPRSIENIIVECLIINH